MYVLVYITLVLQDTVDSAGRKVEVQISLSQANLVHSKVPSVYLITVMGRGQNGARNAAP